MFWTIFGPFFTLGLHHVSLCDLGRELTTLSHFPMTEDQTMNRVAVVIEISFRTPKECSLPLTSNYSADCPVLRR